MNNPITPIFQECPETDFSRVVTSPYPEKSEDQILQEWKEVGFENAVPEFHSTSSTFPSAIPSSQKDAALLGPHTSIPPYIHVPPYSSICKVFYMRNKKPHVASGWIVEGNTGVKGIMTSGHVVFFGGKWANNYVVQRQYSHGNSSEVFTSNFARTLNGWLKGFRPAEFYDMGAIIPNKPVPSTTPALPIVMNYDPSQAPYFYYYDIGYPAKPANGYPFDGEIMWESDGSLINVFQIDGKRFLQAYNAMEQGSSGSPWLIYFPQNNQYYAAGMQASGFDGVLASFSPYFETRNIYSLLLDIGVMK